MKYKAILFDLDGTLLPMEQDTFVEDYFRRLARHLAPFGYEPGALIKGIWAGTGAMIKNDGQQTNEARFWDTFCGLFGEQARRDEPEFERYYKEDFPKVQGVCGFDPEAGLTIARLKAMGLRLILATNPIFPRIATMQRVGWAGLRPEDFELVTTYENSSFCKPNPRYYMEILEKQNLQPEECLMVGNDATEDLAAAELGMDVFLIPRCLINKGNRDLTAIPQGTLAQLPDWIQSRP